MQNEEELSLEASSSSSIAAPPFTANFRQQLGPIKIPQSAERVCTTWWKVSHHMKTPQVEEICRVAVDRSQGELLKIGIENFGNTDLLSYVAQRCSQLRHLRLVRCHGNFAGGLAIAAKNFPLLEKLDVCLTSITKEDVESVGLSCPRLKSLILNDTSFEPPASQDNDKALAIAKTMPELRRLQFRANNLTYEALQAIFEGCPHLESPDLGLY